MQNEKPNIMIVEDEEIVTSDIKFSLIDFGYNIISTVSCGEEAIESFIKNRPDLVIMDIKLAGIMDGIETAKKIKEIDRNTTIIYLTSFRDELAITRAKATEPSAYLLKPFQKDELHSTIEMTFQKQQTEKSLKKSKDYFESLFNGVGNVILLTSLEKKIIDMNKEAENLFGINKTNALMENCNFFVTDKNSLFSEKRCHLEEDTITEICQVPTDKKVEIPIYDQHGQKFYYIWQRNVLYDKNKGITGFLINGHDITKQKEAEKNLIRSNKDLEQFAGVISHDLKSPLQSLILCQDLLMQSIKDKNYEEGKMYVNETLKTTRRMNTQIETILNYSRATKKSTSFEFVDCDEVMKDCICNLGKIIYDKDAEISFSNLPKINFDKVQITQIFQNLINNAINNCTDNKPCIKIKSLFKKNKYIFSIEDNGKGIKREDFENIFHMFERLNSSESYIGSGIGLSICKKIIENYGGKIWLKSKVAIGTTFYFIIPERTEDRRLNEGDRRQ